MAKALTMAMPGSFKPLLNLPSGMSKTTDGELKDSGPTQP